MAELMTLEEMRQHRWTVSWSGGKDSTATILLMRQYGIPIEHIIYVRMMWDDTLPATLPVMNEFVDRVTVIFRDWGYRVDIVPSICSATDLRDREYKKSRFPELNGTKYGVFAFMRGYCKFSSVKSRTIAKVADKDSWQMIGYRADETDRIHRLGGRRQSIMVTLGIKETDAFRICREADMLSPLYGMQISRDGCWFCPNAGKKWRELLREDHPELVRLIDEMIEMGAEHFKQFPKAYNLNEWCREYPYYKKYQQLRWTDVLEDTQK